MPRLKLGNLGAGGIIKDVPEQELAPELFSDGGNVRFTKSGVETIQGDRLIVESTLTTPLWLMQAPSQAEAVWVYGDLTKLCSVDGVTHLDRSRTGLPYSGADTERWNGTILNGLFIANNTFDVPQVLSQASGTDPFIDLPNWPGSLRCKSLRAFKNFLFAMNLTESSVSYPYRLRWSHPAAPGAVPGFWTTNDPRYDSRQLDLGDSDDAIIDGASLGDLFIVYRARSAYAFQYIGGLDKFRNVRILDNHGVLARDCVANTPRGHVVLGGEDVYLHTGQRGSEVSLVQDRVKNWFFSKISTDYYYNSFVVVNQLKKEVMICIPESGSVYASFALLWNWADGTIGFRELPETPFISSGFNPNPGDTSDVWGE